MKMNNLLFFINKHKNIVYLSLLVLVLMLGLIFHKPIIEGLTSNMIGEYDYLKPVNEIVSDDTWKRLTTVQCSYNKHACPDDLLISTIPRTKASYNTAVTTDEINYFIQNGYWPWGSYITNAMKVRAGGTISDSDLDQLKKTYPTRMLYNTYAINQTEKAMNPQPLSYKIYMGFTPPPTGETETETTATGTATGTTTTGTTTTGTNNYYNKLVSAVGTIRGTATGTTTGTATTATNKYYNEFVSLCKKVNPVSS
jgi:hypothetical protein